MTSSQKDVGAVVGLSVWCFWGVYLVGSAVGTPGFSLLVGIGVSTGPWVGFRVGVGPGIVGNGTVGDGVVLSVGDGVVLSVGAGVWLDVGDGVVLSVGDGVVLSVGDGVWLSVGDGVGQA